MTVKKETKKKKHWERWKAKSIINIKNKSLKEKINVVKKLEKELPKEDEKEEKNKWWRPEVITPAVVSKLKLCFSVWMTDEQACYFCWITKTPFYEYQKKNPKFKEEKEILKESITMQARVNVWKSIKNWNVTDSWRWLEKKDNSFIPKMQVGWEFKIEMTEEQKKKESKLLNKMKSFLWA